MPIFALVLLAGAAFGPRYGPFLANSTLWKNVAMSPQQPESWITAPA